MAAFIKKINLRAKTTINTGFGSNNAAYGGRFVNKDGKPNIEKRGLPLLQRISWFHTMLQLSNTHFLLVIFSFFIGINLAFAGIYCALGLEHLGGLNASTGIEKFTEAFFFSAQTFTTVGYGRINPIGFITSAVASFEALLGLLTFAIATGLFYARFSKPRAYIRFSENAVVAPFKEGTALMFRLASYKNNTLTDAVAKIMASVTCIEDDGKKVNRFYQLDLEYDRVNSLNLNWTIVHPINENSPFYQFTEEDFKNTEGEILVFITAFDDMYSNTVAARTSYTFNEIITGARFTPMFHRNEAQNHTIIDLEKLNSYEKTDIGKLIS